MNLNQALEAAVVGERVRAVDMPPGVYIDYQFNGWRKCFPSGSHSGWNPTPHDEIVLWEVVEPEPEPTGWAVFKEWGT